LNNSHGAAKLDRFKYSSKQIEKDALHFQSERKTSDSFVVPVTLAVME